MEEKNNQSYISQKENLEKSLADYKKSIKIDDITSPISKMSFIFWGSCVIAFIYSNFWIAILGYVLSIFLDYIFIEPTRKEAKNKIKLKELEIKEKIELLKQENNVKNFKQEDKKEAIGLNSENYISIEDNFDTNKDIDNSEEISSKSLPPEKSYNSPRKIDWDTLNEKRKITGLKGEEIVFMLEKDYFKSINREDLANKVRHISIEKGDGAGYDILSFTIDGNEKYIEVKSTSQLSSSSFYLSKNELNFLKNHIQDAFVYRLLNIKDDEEPLLKVYSADEILNSNSIIPTQYMVRME